MIFISRSVWFRNRVFRLKTLSEILTVLAAVTGCAIKKEKSPDSQTPQRQVVETSKLTVDRGPRRRVGVSTIVLQTSGERVAETQKKLTEYFAKELAKGDLVLVDPTPSSRFRVETKILELNGKPEMKESEGITVQQGRFEVKIQMALVANRSGKSIYDTTKTFTHHLQSTRLQEPWPFAELIQNRTSFAEELIKDGLLDFVVSIHDALLKTAWEGRIAAIRDNRYFLNVGESTGLKKGDILKVYGEEQEVFDSQSGNLIGADSGPAKGTLEIVDFVGPDGSVGRIHSGGGFRENDRLQLFF